MKKPQLMSIVAALLGGTVFAAEPVVSADWFPLVNGAIYDYKNDVVVSSTTARVTVTTGQTFNGIGGLTKWAMVVPCDATTGKSDWGGEASISRTARSFGSCINYSRYLAASQGGVVAFGSDRQFVDYGYLNNRPTFSQLMSYTGFDNTVIVKDGAVPGDYVFSPLPIPNGSYVLQGRNGSLWQNNASATSIYTGISRANTSATGIENFREVGVYPVFQTYASPFRSLYVEDAILETSAGYAPSQLRYQSWQYAKGLGPIVIRTGDFKTIASGVGFVANNSYGDAMMETFTLVRHNLAGCPGYDASLPPLPANSGNICDRIYGASSPVIKTMTEYYFAPLDYYFITSRGTDKAVLDGATGWSRTGKSFSVFASTVPGSAPINRFYFDQIARNKTRGSHFYSLLSTDVAALTAANPGNTQGAGKAFNEGVDSFAYLPTFANGKGVSCAAGTVPVYRMFRGNARVPDDPNHRFTTDKAVFDQFVANGWDDEGIAMCAPQ